MRVKYTVPSTNLKHWCYRRQQWRRLEFRCSKENQSTYRMKSRIAFKCTKLPAMCEIACQFCFVDRELIVSDSMVRRWCWQFIDAWYSLLDKKSSLPAGDECSVLWRKYFPTWKSLLLALNFMLTVLSDKTSYFWSKA